MKALVFAAGLGTRLRPLTDDRPKALVPLAGGTLLSAVIARLKACGVDEFVINLHHFAPKVLDYLAQNGNFSTDIKVSVEEDRPLETGGGMRKAAPLLRGDGHFLVHNVDIISNLDIPRFVASARPEALSTLLVSPRETSRYLLFDDDMRLRGWTNVSTGEVRTPFADLDVSACRKFAFGGIHYVSDRMLDLMEDWPEAFPIMDFYLKVAADEPVYGYVSEDLKLIDVGKIETLRQAEEFYSTL